MKIAQHMRIAVPIGWQAVAKLGVSAMASNERTCRDAIANRSHVRMVVVESSLLTGTFQNPISTTRSCAGSLTLPDTTSYAERARWRQS
jgi:hypothetical protein